MLFDVRIKYCYGSEDNVLSFTKEERSFSKSEASKQAHGMGLWLLKSVTKSSIHAQPLLTAATKG